MDEAGDVAAPFFGKEKSLITKLLDISEANQNEIHDKNAFCGWQPHLCSQFVEECPEAAPKKSTRSKTSKGNNALQWRETVQLDSPQNQQKKDATQTKKKRPKYHIKRIEELSHPRKIRDKVDLNTHTKVLVPFSNPRPLNSAVYFDNKIFAMTKVALKYGETGPELGRLSNTVQSTVRVENTRSAHERIPAEKSVQKLLSSKNIRSAGTTKNGGSKRSREVAPSILVKTRADAGMEWEELSVGSDIPDEIAPEDENEPLNNVDLPLPQAKLSNVKINKQQKCSEWTFALPPLQQKTNKKQRALGSITAITQGNINAGIKTNSIKKIRRQTIPQTSVILPKLSGSKVEVPLLPQSPDFLHRLM